MKYVLSIALILLSCAAFAGSPNLTPPLNPITQVYVDYSAHNVTTSAYYVILASVPQEASKMEIFDSSGQTMLIAESMDGVSYQILGDVFPGGNGLIGYHANLKAKIAVKAVTGTANSGYLIVNFYN